MPVKLERKLKATAKKRGYGKKRTGAYVYGTLAEVKKRKHLQYKRGNPIPNE